MGTIMKGNLQIGGSTIPIKLTTTARSLRSSKAQLHYASPCCFGRVGRKNYCKDCGKELTTPQIKHRSFEIEKGRQVIITKDEIDSIKKVSTKRFVTEMFVPQYTLPRVFSEKAYYVAPDELGEIPLTILARAMQLTNAALVGKYVTRNAEKLGGITVFDRGLVLQNLYFYQAIVDPPQNWKVLENEVSEDSVKKMSRVIEAMTDDFEHKKFQSVFYEKFKELVLSVKDREAEEIEKAEALIEAPVKTADDFMKSIDRTLDGIEQIAEK